MRLIDADALIAQIEAAAEQMEMTVFKMAAYAAINDVKHQPTIEERKTGRWIPCSERLPIARRSVIISTKDWTGEGCYWETTEHHVIWKGYRWNATYWDDEVTAWCELPEPYREGGEAE